MATVGVKGF